MTENKYNKQKASELYNTVTSLAKIGSSEEQFYEKLNDPAYAEKVYDRFSTKYGTQLLGAPDKNSFLDSLGYNKPAQPSADVAKVEQKEVKPVTPQLDSLKIQTPDSINTEVPRVAYTAPETPDMQLKMPSFGQKQNIPFNPEQSFSIKDIIGETPEQRFQAEIENLGEDASLDVAKVDIIKAKIENEINTINKNNESFLKEYDRILREADVRDVNLHHDSWSPSMPWNYRKQQKDSKYITEGAERYEKIQRQKDALQRQIDLLDTYRQYAEYGRQLKVGEQLSAYVSNGKLSQNAFDNLRNTRNRKAQEAEMLRLYKNGEIDESVLRDIYNLGDLHQDNGVAYGLFKTGKVEDMLSLGLNEIARNIDLTDIAKKAENGTATAEEIDTYNMYNKLAQMKKKVHEGKEFGFGFTAGMGIQQSLRFVLESALTGGLAGTGKSLGAKGVKALIENYALRGASKKFFSELGGRALKSAGKQALLTPATPSMYSNYTERVLGLEMQPGEASWWDKAKELYGSYVDTFTERFSEVLGNLAGDIPVMTFLTKGKATKDLTNRWVRTLAQITDNDGFKKAKDALEYVGINGVPEEILSEMSGNIMNGILTMDSEPFKQMTDRDFYKQIALQSVLMAGAGSIVSYTGGSIGAAMQSKQLQKQYDEAMADLHDVQFNDERLDALKAELEDAMYRQHYVTTNESSNERSVGDIMADINSTIELSGITNSDDANHIKEVFGIVDHAVRTGAYKHGEQQAVKSYVEDKIGEYENEDGKVYEFTDTDGKQYFVLDSSSDAVVLMDRNTGEKVIKTTSILNPENTKEHDSSTWALNTFIGNINQWNAQKPADTQVKTDEFIPANKLIIGNQIVPVVSYNPETESYTVADEQGNTYQVKRNDPDVEEVFAPENTNAETPTEDEGTQEVPPTTEAPVEGDGNMNNPPVGDVNGTENTTATTNEQPVQEVPQEGGNGQQEEVGYIPPKNEQGQIKWTEIPDENIKEVLDKTFPAEGRALKFIDARIKEAKQALTNLKKKKAPSDEVGFNQYEDALDSAQKAVAKWESIKTVYMTPATAPVTEVGTEQSVSGTQTDVPVVDDSRDNPADARARGYKMVNGVRYDRQTEMKSAKYGAEVEIKFAKGVSAKGRRAVAEADELQPSHINGAENPLYFSPERQPKDRTDAVSAKRADEIASAINPEEITGGVTAYTGAPSVDMIGEAIQGNGRLDALKRMYKLYPEQAAIYKQYLVDHAAEWGFDPNEIAAMQSPILVNALNVTEEQAIQLGQRTAQDIESGGEQKIVAQNVAQTLGKDIKSLANILLKTEDEDADINDVVSENAYEALKWLTAKKVITETQMQTAMDEKGNITVEAREALKDILSQIIFQGGNKNIRKEFKMLPKAAQKALLQTIARELDSAEGEGILENIQEAIEVYASLMNDPDFKKAKTSEDLMAAALSWAKQIQMDFTEGNFVPEDRYSNFAIALAVIFKANTMKQQSAMLNQLYDYTQAEGGDIFNPAVKLSKAEAVKQVYGVELNEKQNEKGRSGLLEANDGESSTGGQGSSADVGVSGQTKQDVGQTNDSGTSGTSDSGASAATEQIDVDTLKAGQVSIETAKAAIDSQKGADATVFVDGKVAQAEQALSRANKLAQMASTEADIARAQSMIEEAQNDLKFWSDLLNLYNQSNDNANGTSGQSNTEVSQETPNSGAETANQTGQTEQENPQGAGNQSDNRGVNPDEGHSRLGDLKTEIHQKGLRRQGVELENAYDNVLGSGSKLWKTWADRYNTSSYALLMQLKQAQKEARGNNGWVSDATFKKVYARIYQHAGSDIVLNAMKGNTGPSSKTLIPKNSILGKRGIESGVHYGLDTLVSLYNDYNIQDEEIDALAEKVFSVAKNLGIGVIFSNKKFGKGVAGYSANTNTISLNTNFFNSDDFYKERKADLKKTALHEVIHAVTSYALEKKNAHKLTPEMKQAVDELNAVYTALKKDRKFFTFYGSKNVKEMVAEMANPEFRAYLKERGVFKRIVGAISKFFISSENQNTNAFTEINNALNKLLDSFNEELYNEYNGISNIETQEDIVEESSIDDVKLSAEEEAIVKKSKADGIYLKAPNGKGTNLTPKQWVQVRTKAFKEWFGDWEMWFKKNFLLNGDIVSSLSGNEFERVDGKTLTEQVAEYFESIGGKAMSPIYGEVILDEKGAEDSLSHGIGRNKAIAYAAVKDVIENGVLIDYDKNHKGRDYDSALIAAPITIGGERYICEVVITRKQDNRFYLHEVTSVKKLQDAVSLTNSGQSPTAHQGVIAKVLQNIISANDNVSKVVDENGEPMVVYHGSISETIDSFDKSKIRANETDAYYNGFWFSTDPDTSPAWRSANKVYPVFLNIRNLITREDAHKIARKYFKTDDFVESLGINGIRSGADAVRAKLQADGYDGVADFIHPKIDISEFKETGQTIFKTSGGTKYIIAQESDGINVYEYDYYSDDHKGEFNTAVDTIEEFFDDAYFFGDEIFVAFEPNQIKSATDNVGTFSKENDDIRFRLAEHPIQARQDSEEVMQQSIDQMAKDLGVAPEYISDEKQLDKKGWYDPKTGKVVVNLAAHETIADAQQTYLHETVGHFGLRGLLKDKFGSVMTNVFNSLPKDVQSKYLSEYKDKTIAAEEYLSQMAESDIEPSLVEKILGFIREALRGIGINTDNYTNGDLQYLLWRAKNNLRENAGSIEAAKWGAKNKEIRYRTLGRPAGYSTNNIEMTRWDKLMHNIQDRMRPVKKIMDEIKALGGYIDEHSDPWSQEFLSTSRADAEIQDFKNTRYEPLANAIAEAMKVISEKLNVPVEEARKLVDDYLYARHAPERNKHICVNEIEQTLLGDVKAEIRRLADEWVKAQAKAQYGSKIMNLTYSVVEDLRKQAAQIYNDSLLNNDAKAAIRELASMAYDAQFKNGVIDVDMSNLSPEQEQLINALTSIAQNKAASISREAKKDQQTGQTVVVANNRSGMSDKEAEQILGDIYTPETAAALDEVSARVKDCTNFTLEKWLQYGLISQDEYNAYQNQYQYYIPLRGWDEKSEDIDYTEIPTKQFNMASEIVNLNRHAKGRIDKAENPLAYIASLAMSAAITGNRNLIRQHAFNMVDNNAAKIAHLAVIENTYELYDEQGNIIGYTKKAPPKEMFNKGLVKIMKDKTYEYHKTGAQLGAHRVSVMIDGVRHIVYFKGKIGVLAATAINGTDNDTRNVVMQGIAKTTRFISSNLTAKNVYFMAKNTVRDLIFGNFAYFVENGFGRGWKLNTHFNSALRTAFNDARGKQPDPNNPKDVQMYNLYQEFKLNGGQTGYVQLENIDRLGKQMDKLIAEAAQNGGIVTSLVNSKDFILDSINALGKASENAMRFAVYRLERESGASPREAAIKAKQITVNFNQQGKNTRHFSTLYAFFNPAIQGTTRFVQLMKANPKRFFGALGTLTAMKMISAIACQMLSGGDDEEEGKTAYDRLSDYVKATNIIIPLGVWSEGGEDKFLCIPLAQSVRGPVSIADGFVDMMMGKKDAGDVFKNFVMFNLGEFLPFDIDAIDLGGDNPVGSVVQAATPTVARPFVEAYLTNKDFMGNPVHKEPYLRDQDYIPQHELAFRSTSPFLVGVSKVLNELAGGDDKRSAKLQISENGRVRESGWNILDINPANVEHVLSGYFGGIADIFIDTYNVAMGATSKDVEIDTQSYPIFNQFVKEATTKPGYKSFYKMSDEAQNIIQMWSLYRNDYQNNRALFENRYNSEVVGLYKSTAEQVRDMNKAILSADTAEEKAEITRQRDELVKQTAETYDKLVKQYGEY